MNKRFELISIDKVDDLLEVTAFGGRALHEGGYRVRIMVDGALVVTRYFCDEESIEKMTLQGMAHDDNSGKKVEQDYITEARVCNWITTESEDGIGEIGDKKTLLLNTLNVVALLRKHGLWNPRIRGIIADEFAQVCQDWYEDETFKQED